MAGIHRCSKNIFTFLVILNVYAQEISLKNFFPLSGKSAARQKTGLVTESCGDSHSPFRLTLRHIERNGVGYDQGYTTLEAFVVLLKPEENFMFPFLDIRGHVFNDGQFATNIGIGGRYIGPVRVWGINVYYDYRDSQRKYNQISVGLESLGEAFDLRLNGYLPFGQKVSSLFGNPSFQEFQGNYAIASFEREFTLKGANAEVGVQLKRSRNIPLYLAGGPYYLSGQEGAIWGGQLRVALDFYEYVRLEGSGSYDPTFNWIGQGQFSISIPLGKKRAIKRQEGIPCSRTLALRDKALQRIDRNEIIPVDTQNVSAPVMNPSTNSPYFFWFVNNTSHSAGTFESPFPTLLAAQQASASNDIIYVFPGNGTSTGMNAGITLKNNQSLFGAGIAQTLPISSGSFTIPALSSSLPHITNSTGNVVNLADNNTVSGFNIFIDGSFHNGLSGTGISNLTVNEAIFTTNTDSTNGIFLFNPTGSVVVQNSSFSGFTGGFGDDGNGIFLNADNSSILSSFTLSNILRAGRFLKNI